MWNRPGLWQLGFYPVPDLDPSGVWLWVYLHIIRANPLIQVEFGTGLREAAYSQKKIILLKGGRYKRPSFYMNFKPVPIVFKKRAA